MINFVEKIDRTENPFRKFVRCKDHLVYFFGHGDVRRYVYQCDRLYFELSFEQSIDCDFSKVLFLNQVLWDDKGNLLVVNANQPKNTVFLSLYNAKGICLKKTSICRRHSFTECHSLSDNQLAFHDHQNYLEIYQFGSDFPDLLVKVYKLSLRIDMPFILTGFATSQQSFFLMAFRKDALVIYQQDFNIQISKEENCGDKPPNRLNAEEGKEKVSHSKPAKYDKKIDNLSSFTVIAEMDIPESYPLNFICHAGALFFNTENAVFRLILGNTVFDTFEITSVIRIEPNDDMSVIYLSMINVGLLSVKDQKTESFDEAIRSWRDWGVQEKSELGDLQKISAQTYFVLTPQDCFILEEGRFVRGLEFFPVLTESFRI